jgi:hypothetical protein
MGKRQDFIDLYRSGKGTRQKYIDLSGHGFRRKSTAVPVDPLRQLMIYEMLMSGALPSELKHGGIASLTPRRGRVTHPGGYAGWKGHPFGSDWDDLIDHMIEQGFITEDDLIPGATKPTTKPTLHAQGGLAGILNLS